MHLYSIIDNFKTFFSDEVQKEMNTLYMTDTYEDLHTACGIIGSMLQMPGYDKLMITKPETRMVLQNAYQACDIIHNNIIYESELSEILMKLKACYYSLLNFTYNDTDKTATEAMNNVLEICEMGLDLLEIVKNTDEEKANRFYVNQNEATLHKRLDQLTKAFEMLQPKPPIQKGDDSNEKTC
jgi:phosphoenolpyruvate carboxylase